MHECMNLRDGGRKAFHEIDELRVQAIGDGSAVLAEAALTRSVDWFDSAGAAPPAAGWVEPLRQATKARAEALVPAEHGTGGLVLVSLLFYLVLLSVILQIVARRKLEGFYGRLASAFAMEYLGRRRPA